MKSSKERHPRRECIPLHACYSPSMSWTSWSVYEIFDWPFDALMGAESCSIGLGSSASNTKAIFGNILDHFGHDLLRHLVEPEADVRGNGRAGTAG